MGKLKESNRCRTCGHLIDDPYATDDRGAYCDWICDLLKLTDAMAKRNRQHSRAHLFRRAASLYRG